MATKEYKSFANPLRAYSTATTYQKQKDVFEKQAPGTLVQVFESSATGQNQFVVYRATTSKTSKGQTVWEKIVTEPLKGEPVQATGQYIWVNNGQPGKSDSKFSTIGIDGKIITYEDSVIKNLIVKNRIKNPQIYGNFIFVRLASLEEEGVTTSTTSVGAAASSTSPASTNAMTKNSAVDMEFLEKLQEANRRWDKFYKEGQKTSGSNDFDPERNNGSSNPSPNNSGPGRIPRNTSGRGQNQSGSGGSTVNIVVSRTFDSGIVYNNAMPYMEQKYSIYERSRQSADVSAITRNDVIRRHFFDIVPNSFEFSQLSSTWNEVPRSGNYAYVDWSNYNLTKVSFRFLITGVRDARFGPGFFSGQNLNDGLDVPIDEQIDNLRSMAASPSPVRIYNMNTLLTNSFRYPFMQKAGGISWVIADMSVTANRLTPNGKNIAAAEVSITLNEYPIIARDIIYVPKLRPGKDIPECCPPPTNDPKRDLFTNTYDPRFRSGANTLSHPAPKDG